MKRSRHTGLELEVLESRLNLSVGIPAVIHHLPTVISGEIRRMREPLVRTSMPGVLMVGGPISVPINSYTAISNSQLEVVGGQMDVGWLSPAGGYVEYTIQAPTAGVYSLAMGLASPGVIGVNVSVNGAVQGSIWMDPTWAWQTYKTGTRNVTLAAGTNVVRFASINGTQYNINSIVLTPPAAPPSSTPQAPGGTVTTPTGPAVSVTQKWMTSFTELDIVGTSGNDSIYVSQSGNTLTINANGNVQTVTGAFGEIVIWGAAGNDSITVNSTVKIDARMYGGAGTNVLVDQTQGKGTIVSLAGTGSVVTGNQVNTSYWVGNSDIVNASGGEWGSRVHFVSGIVPDGANLADPASNGSGWTRLTANSLWGTGPMQEDVNQGMANDCYFLTPLASAARLQPGALRELAVDLGDGTYAVQFIKGGVKQYVRVDGDLPTASWGGLYYSKPGASGNIWAAIMEKAYSIFRYGQNSYTSLDYGWMTSADWDLWGSGLTYYLPADQASFYNTVSAKLSAGNAVEVGTVGVISGGAPLVASHAYSVVGVNKDINGTVLVTLRNPWGIDGFNVDANPYDGLVTVTFAQLRANSNQGSYL